PRAWGAPGDSRNERAGGGPPAAGAHRPRMPVRFLCRAAGRGSRAHSPRRGTARRGNRGCLSRVGQNEKAPPGGGAPRIRGISDQPRILMSFSAFAAGESWLANTDSDPITEKV